MTRYANLALLILFPVAWFAPLMRAGLLPLFGLSEISVISGLQSLWRTDVALALLVTFCAIFAPLMKVIGRALRDFGLLHPAVEPAPSAYAAAVQEGDLRWQVTLAEGVTSWMVTESLKHADFLDGSIASVPPEGSLAPDSYDVARGADRAKLIADMTAKDMDLQSPILVRLFKQEAELEIWKQDRAGRFALLKTYPICRWSGQLGPKQREGDRQAPEGFYTVKPAQMNPASNYHLAFNLGYPNAFDRANGRTGSFLMVHGSCVSIGCFAMTDGVIEEIWTLMQAAFEGGQKAVDVHVFPFAMTEDNLAAQWGSEHLPFWASLAPAWTQFEATARVPDVKVSGKAYEVLGAQ